MIRQETTYNCGPTCLQIIWHLHGKEPLPQSAFAAMAGTTPIGTGIWGLKRAIRAMGLDFVVRKGKDSFKRPPSNHAIVFDNKKDHWLVVSGSKNKWDLHDPESGLTENHTKRSMRLKFFNQHNSYALFVKDR